NRQHFADGPAFEVQRQSSTPYSVFESEVNLKIRGYQSAAEAQFEAIINVTAGDPLLDKAISILGDSEMENIQINGNYLIVDEGQRLWQEQGVNKNNRTWGRRFTPDPCLCIDRLASSGKLFNYKTYKQPFAERQKQLQTDVFAPDWSLDCYLENNPDVVVFSEQKSISNQDYDQLVVVVLGANKKFTITDCTLSRGLVVWAEDDYDFLGKERNTIRLKGHNQIGGTGSIGILAPGAQITTQGGLQQDVSGLSIVHSLNKVVRLNHHGVLIVLNDIKRLYDSSFSYNSTISTAIPPGIKFYGKLPRVQLTKLYESTNLD
ncbi:MAG: hypothetical protein QGF46_03930, partial [Planctomycetota bacterium]|nr:hypothetical protein [Planctomycetota bacterium]